MPRPKGSKNKPKVDAKGNSVVKPSKALKKAVAKKEVKLPAAVEKAVKTNKAIPVAKKAQPETKVSAPSLEPETPVAKSPKTLAAAGKNSGEAVIRPVDDDADDANENTVVIVAGKAQLRKSKSNPDLD